ncbi:bifunctional diguanylate cyclase/phosphodiesterase [Aquipuribacter sp. SD81]|uniref:bifunctional diguanylate cyclase/phosphodiesterase n=1 Tax=Aquipuribacter sp. SD81 TaxID=3127703 RepID=UPI0030163592
MDRVLGVLLGAVALGVLGYPFLPVDGRASDVAYPALAVGSLLVGWTGLALRRPVRVLPWTLLLAGYSAWVAGDLLFVLETEVWRLGYWPAWSDVLYLSGYGLLALGALQLVRSRRQRRDGTALLDAAIVTIGVAVPTVAFVVVPAATDTTASLLGKLVSSAYPAGDLFLLAMLARLATTPGARTLSFRLLVASLGVTLVTDAAWNVAAVSTGYTDVNRWMDLGWLAGYVLIAGAALSRDMRVLTERPPDREQAPGRVRLAMLAAALSLPGATLVADGVQDGDVAWATIGVGAIVLSLLVLVRMAGLLDQVRVQAVQLAAVARLDPLTGTPNRRTWDLELSRAVHDADASGEPLCVAMLDVDHFKRWNDTHGHQRGDELLREAATAWTAGLGEGRLLARYGGEEFAVLLPGSDLVAARHAVDRLRALTPHGQTFSAGVARWQPGTEPGAAVAAADQALYQAKRRGRDRVAVHGESSARLLPTWVDHVAVAVQPVVDLATGAVVAHEALARFPHSGDVTGVFEAAWAEGFGDLLELETVGRALTLPGRPPGTALHVNVSGAALASERFWSGLPARLDDVVVELGEDHRVPDWAVHADAVRALRERGARVAVDDLGAGAGDLARVLAIRPDLITLDRGVVTGCGTDPAREGLVRALLQLARSDGARVCAEGVETEADLDVLRALGVDLVQGFLLGRPRPAWCADADLPHVARPGSLSPS